MDPDKRMMARQDSIRGGLMARVRRRLTFANVVSLMALFVALSGGAYAVTIPKRSVGARQLKRNAVTRSKIKNRAVTSSKVKDRSLRAKDFRSGELPAGPTGAKGVQGIQGPQGHAGAKGPPGPFPGTLSRGITLRGIYAIRFTAQAAFEFQEEGISFGFRFSSAPRAHYVAPPPAGVVPAECAGGSVDQPEAKPGNICFFSRFRKNEHGNLFVISPTTFGDQIEVEAEEATKDTDDDGSWAATSP
jgi:hypothetical protein